MWFGGAPSWLKTESDARKKQPWVLLTVILVVGAIVVSVISNEKISRFDEDAIVAHEYMESPSSTSDLKSMRLDKSVRPEELDVVPQKVGEKESEMEGSVILSDGAETEKHQIEMDRASLNEANRDDQVRLVDEKELSEARDGKHVTSTSRDVMDKQDMHLEMISEEELPLKPMQADFYKSRGCGLFRRCYRKFCDVPRCAQVDGHRSNCKRTTRCRGYGLLKRCTNTVRCTPRPYTFAMCDHRPTPCGDICRVLTLCKNHVDPLEKFNFLCYNRYCARRYCARECTQDVKVCKRYRRCYRRCVGECGKKDTQCVHRCYNYKKCHRLNKCYNRCFIKREVCGNRCVHKTTSSSEALTHYESPKRYGETSGKKKKHLSSGDKKKKSSEKKKGKKHAKSAEKKKNTKSEHSEHPEEEHPEETHPPQKQQRS